MNFVDESIDAGKSREQYPLVMTVHHVAEILGISKRTAYELMDLKTFPLLKVGRCKRVSREAFFNWMNRQNGEIEKS